MSKSSRIFKGWMALIVWRVLSVSSKIKVIYRGYLMEIVICKLFSVRGDCLFRRLIQKDYLKKFLNQMGVITSLQSSGGV